MHSKKEQRDKDGDIWTSGAEGPTDPCPGKEKQGKGREMGPKTKQQRRSEEKQTILLNKISECKITHYSTI